MTDIAEIGFIADTAELKGAKTALRELVPATKAAETETEKLNRTMDRGSGYVSKFMRTLQGFTSGVGRALTSTLGQIAAGFAAAFTAQALIQKIVGTAHALDDVSKAARAVGSTVEQMQALSVAGDLAGVSVDALAMATRRNNRVLGAAIAAGKGNEGVFKRLGVSAKELAALPIDERFALIADRMKELNFSTSDVTATLAALGDRGGMLIGLLGEGGDQIRKAASDVKQFGLAITDIQGLQIEDMNDNFSRLGYSIQGAFNQFIAFIAPTLGAIFLGLAQGIAFVVQHVGVLGDLISVVGPALAVAFGPAIIAGVWGLATALFDGAVAGVVALTAAIMANPLLALAVAITGIITLIWAFRDDIKNVFGVDLEAIVKSAGNFLIRSFMTAFEDIKFVFNNFPNIIGAAVIGAVNLVITGVNAMVKGAIDGLNFLIAQVKVNPMTAGIAAGIGFIDPKSGQIPLLENAQAAAVASAAAQRDAAVAAIQTTDYVKQLTDAYGQLSTATTVTTVATGNLGTALDGVASGSGKAVKDGLKAIRDAAEATQEKIDDLRQSVMDTAGQAFKSFFSDIMHGKSAIDALTNALGNLADKLMDMVLDNALNGIIGSLFGGGLGVGKGLTGAATYGFSGNGMFGLPGHAAGTVMTSPTMLLNGGGLSKMAESGPEAIMPLRRAGDGSLGVVNVANDHVNVVYVQPIINNNVSDQVDASTAVGDDGSLIVTIDRINARLIGDTTSQTNKAHQRAFGSKNATKAR
jgi:uncharacterized protein YukE